MHKVLATIAFGMLLAISWKAALAQGWPSWANDAFDRSWSRERESPPSDRDVAPRPQQAPKLGYSEGYIRDGGQRPEIAPQAPPIVAFSADFPVHSIVIDSGARKLYYVLPDHRAYQYAVSVGREGFGWTGTETISRKQAWPDWYPPVEMRARDPRLPEKMTGGVKNPLGAMALYLGNTLYRIHGTNDVKSIGQAQSSGCFRMLNPAVLHLAAMADVGTTVNVVAALPRQDVDAAHARPSAAANGADRPLAPPTLFNRAKDMELRAYETDGR